ncbi:DUF1566 domain-containing protein [Glaciecola petra]|uniref:DUF1566 domain-containing protein n=1 Tax=Glaciecola petra TaxID=3075602 RepID=A0ABU2ZTF0_9ALTE|nr:DUF1566 domain-containing protein [Aestuariibacter sp. P117]MDT0595918.1 DUF1566 domain-containing protein [Aestuariibacter sp. P117]
MKKVSFKVILVLMLFTLSSIKVIAQTAVCASDISPTTDSEEFTILDSGNVWHIPSNLVFMRCSIGQTFDGTTCTGESRSLSWQQALVSSIQVNIDSTANLPSWRLPNIKELAVISERACVRPAINEEVFPNTPPDAFWTSTPSVKTTDMAWSITYTNASQSLLPTNSSLFVRLVRSRLATE